MENAGDMRRILAVEDNETQARILAAQLSKDYDVVLAASGEECLQKVAQDDFAFILLDVVLPGISGYEVCRRLKADPATSDIPVMFLSGNFTMEDRLQGFEAGGFDYMVKPVVKVELLKKIAILLSHIEEKRSLKSSADFAVSTAMTAMTSAAEQGLVLQFMKTSFTCNSYRALANAVIDAAKQFGLEALVQIRGEHDAVACGNNGPCTPLEESILANVGKGGRIVDLKSRTAINYARASLMIKNMPTDDAERYGRLKDHLTMLLEGADARCAALDLDRRLDAEAQRMMDVVHAIGETLVGVTGKTRQLHGEFGDVFNRLMNELEGIIPLLELGQSQEALLDRLLRDTSGDYVVLTRKETEVENALQGAMELLKGVASHRQLP